ncbi:MerR family transcriptional regulator [Enterococcus sp. AZ192]|uniref:MerR family transcriptional regulator n=1 Tax=unclassified Enterococcus TaxID=2608891 RepID=UPI003D266B3C
MKISELSKLTGVKKETIRYYESIGLLTPDRNTNGYRKYTEQELKDLSFILKLKRLSIPLNEVKMLMDIKRQNTSIACKEETLYFLEQYIKISQDILAFLTKSIDILVDIKHIVGKNNPNEENEIIQRLALFEEEF